MSDLKPTPEADNSGSGIDLDELLELRANATARAWKSFGSLFGGDLGHCTCSPTKMAPEFGGELGHGARCGILVLGETEDAEDAHLIVAAVNSLVPLIERVRELEESEKDLLEQDDRNLAEMNELADQRDQARGIAVVLEQQLAQLQTQHDRVHEVAKALEFQLADVAYLHVPDDGFCREDGFVWPCPTGRAVGARRGGEVRG